MENRATAVTDHQYRGANGWRDWMNDMLEEFTGSARCELEEIVFAEDDCVVAAFRISGVSVHSGEPLAFRWVGVTWMRDGQAIRSAGFATRGEALEAAGMRPTA
jgi:ketosteroid isomerase-like protein